MALSQKKKKKFYSIHRLHPKRLGYFRIEQDEASNIFFSV